MSPAVSKVSALMLTTAIAAAAQSSARSASPTDQKETYNYVLTMDKFEKLAAAKKAMANAHPERKDQGSVRNIDEAVQKIQSSPEAVAALKTAGVTPREYFVGSFALARAMMVVANKKAGGRAYSGDMEKGVNPANITFVEQHWDQVTKMMQ